MSLPYPVAKLKNDIKNKTSWALKIGASTDAARPLILGGEHEKDFAD